MPFRAFRAVSRFVFHFVCLFFPFDTSQCLFNHSSDCFYLSGTRVKTLSFATRKLPPRRRSHIQPLLIPRFKDNPNFESGFTSRSLPLITNCLVILSAIFHPSPLFFFFPCPTAFSRPHFPWLRLAVGAGLLPNPSGLWRWGRSGWGSAPGIPNHPSALRFFLGDHCLSLFFATFIFLDKKVVPRCRCNGFHSQVFLPAEPNLSQQVSALTPASLLVNDPWKLTVQ